MSKNVLVVCTGPRKGGNSEMLADAFARGVRDAGGNVEKICLYEKSIGFCSGCLACMTTGKCTLRDDASEIVEKMASADVLAFATPVYFYEMCGQMKTLLDRTTPLVTAGYAFCGIYLLAAAGDAEQSAVDGTVAGLQRWVDCYPHAKLAGVARGLSALHVGDIKNSPAALDAAYKMGQSV